MELLLALRIGVVAHEVRALDGLDRSDILPVVKTLMLTIFYPQLVCISEVLIVVRVLLHLVVRPQVVLAASLRVSYRLGVLL